MDRWLTRQRAQRGRVLTAALFLSGIATLGASAIVASAKYMGATSGQPPRFIRHAKVSDKFLSYDGVGGGTEQRTRDWPISIIWTKDATKKKVKLFLGLDKPSPLRGYKRGGLSIKEPEKKRVTDEFRTASDIGNKTECPPDKPRDLHVRYYGATWNGSASYLYDPSPVAEGGWKWFVVMSTHYDFAEDDHPKLDNGQDNPCYGDPKTYTAWNGRSEQATGDVENLVKADTHGYFGAVQCDQVNTKNYEGQEREEDIKVPPEQRPPGTCAKVPHRRLTRPTKGHYWQNDGLATLIPVNSP